jgi:hypothetical protein
MTDTLSPEQIQAGIEAAFKAEIEGTKTPVVETPIVETPKVETPIVETPKVETPIVETPKVETPIVETPKVETPVVVQKSLDEYVAEQSGGKFKTWAEVEEATKPKEIFANEKIKHLNELAEKGIDVTSREFIELQSLDVDSLDKADDILYEKWKRSEDGEGLSEKTIRAEINKKYNVNEWIEKADEDLTDDDRANQEKMIRDAGKGKEWLTNYKNERVLEKQEDPKVLQAMAEDAERAQKNWENFVETDLVNKITKLTTPILGKDGKVEAEFNFDISEADRKKYGDIMKRMPIDTNAFFGQFVKEVNGKPVRDDGAFLTMMIKASNYDKAVALARSEGASQEALRIEKEQKNTNFAPNQTGGGERVFTTVEEAMRDAVGKMKM